MIIKTKILRSLVLASYLGLLAITTLHVHHHVYNGSSKYFDQPGERTTDPFSNSKSECSLVVFSQTSYVGSTPDVLNNATQYFSLNKFFFYTTSFKSFTGLQENLRAPPSIS